MSATATAALPDVRHKVGDKLHGFTITGVTPLPDVRAVAYEATQDKTGARVLHLHADDPENAFAIGFRTPPSDSTGVPHILEHSVLAGSERFPVRDAFNELMKGSLATFINAMTWPDKTVYPVSSAVRADFFNLATVYIDVVLHPRLSRETFLQEGHHLEFEDLDSVDSDLVVSGVVYNEMKGVYSAADAVTFKALQENLYPDNTYGVDSGGDPEDMPNLTYEQFVEFHRSLYSLSNARIFLYGDIPTADQLAFLERETARDASIEVDSHVHDQPRWDKPRKIESAYPVAKDESTANKTIVNVAWMTAETANPDDTILLRVLYATLVGTAAGPLRKALLASGLGEDLSPETVFETDFKQAMFSVGLRGTEREHADKIEKLILDTLTQIAEEGQDEELIRGAFHQIEFAGKEIGSHYPIRLVMRAMETWNYDADPKAGLAFPTVIDQVRKRWEANPKLFRETIKKWLLDNPHRLLAVSYPSPTFSDERAERYKARMAEQKATYSREQLEAIRADALALKQAQEAKDPPEVLAKLPRVTLSDISKDIKTIPCRETKIGDVIVLEHEIFTSGIAYISLAFDIAHLDNDAQTLLPMLGKTTVGMGAAGQDYETLAKRKSLYTGGIQYSVSADRCLHRPEVVQHMSLLGRALYRNVGELANLLRDLLTEADLTDTTRLKDLVFEMRNGAKSGIVQRGHAYARMLAAASMDLTGFRSEQWGGITQLRLLETNATGFDDKNAALTDAIAALRPRVFNKRRLIANITADADGLEAAREALTLVINALPDGDDAPRVDVTKFGPAPVGLAVSTDVNFVARVQPAPRLTDALAPAVGVLSNILSSDYLYEKLRVQGGAYGGFCVYESLNGQFSMLSYRDPNLEKTLQVYDEITTAASDLITDHAVETSIISSLGDFERVLDPCTRGQTAMRRYILGIADDDRRKYRSGLYDVTPALIRDTVLPALAKEAVNAAQGVVSSKERLEAANKEISPPFQIETIE